RSTGKRKKYFLVNSQNASQAVWLFVAVLEWAAARAERLDRNKARLQSQGTLDPRSASEDDAFAPTRRKVRPWRKPLTNPFPKQRERLFSSPWSNSRTGKWPSPRQGRQSPSNSPSPSTRSDASSGKGWTPAGPRSGSHQMNTLELLLQGLLENPATWCLPTG